MRLVNVRLDDEDVRLVRRLRERGVSLASVVRGAIRLAARRVEGLGSTKPEAILAEMQKRYPGPANTTARTVDTTDRRQVQAIIRKKLRRRP
jgi:hypothetical protein